MPITADAALIADMLLYTAFVAVTTQRNLFPSVPSGGRDMLFVFAPELLLSVHVLPSAEYCHL